MSNRNKGEGTIYFSESRNQWIGQFTKTLAGQRIRKSVYGNTKQEVSEKLLDLRIQMKDIDLIKEKGIPIIQIMESIRDRKYSANKIKEGQYKRITDTINKIKQSNIGNLNIKDITSDDIQEFLNNNKNLSNSYIKKLYEQFNQAYEYALRNKYINENPMYDVIKPTSNKKDKEVRALTITEEKELSDYLLSTTLKNDRLKNVYLIQMYMGLRIGEVLALNKNDIDINKQLIFVNRTLTTGKNDEVILGDTTKTYAGNRSIPIPNFLINILKEQLEISEFNKDNFLFLNDNENFIGDSTFNINLKRILKNKLNWSIEGISTHTLRHTFATRCIESGVNAVVLQRLMGHTDISITLNTYTSVFNRFKENELEKVMNLYKDNLLGVVPKNNMDNKEIHIKEVEEEDNEEMDL